ncbi:hypothetical protein F511_35677 [Dorcoceras hygrometricum]|uniref:TRF2/HOY1 PH-like domain-containing protein n=1 Tax=Dorcoceras hygrometricum TaxID=472368 RepID=A0A2Z7C5I1_9LAMI|nr:hypothetical protein F511_35677 [Dorcoceras hygrometricum]
MGEKDGIIFGDNKEENWCGGNLQSNHYYSPEFMNLQKEWCESSSQLSPLGLKLKKSKSFLDLLHGMYENKQEELSTHENPQNSNRNKSKKTDHSNDSGYRKASNFQAAVITIGSWKKLSLRAGDLTAKIYYAKRKLVWEVLEGALKSKMEVEWSQITAIKASLPDNSHGILEIELSNPPTFYRETSPQPKKHTLWHQISDFTGGQASDYRRHLVIFAPGVLDKHYENLLQYSPSLFALSLKPFPSSISPLFDPRAQENSGFSLNCNGYESQRHPRRICPATTKDVLITSNQNSTVSDAYQPYYLPVANNQISWTQGSSEFYVVNGSIQGQSDMNFEAQGNETFASQNHHSKMRELIDTDKYLLGRSQNHQVEPLLHSSHGLLNENFNNSNWMDTEMNYQINDNDQIMQNGDGNGAITGYGCLNNMIGWMPHQDPNQRIMLATMENYCTFNPFTSATGDFLDSAF